MLLHLHSRPAPCTLSGGCSMCPKEGAPCSLRACFQGWPLCVPSGGPGQCALWAASLFDMMSFGLCRCVMWYCTQMPSTEEVARSSPPAEEPSMPRSSQPCPVCVSPSTWWRSRPPSRPLEASTVCSTRSVATSLRRRSDQVSS